MVQAGAIVCGRIEDTKHNLGSADYSAAVIRYLTPPAGVSVDGRLRISVEDQEKVVDAFVFPPAGGIAHRLQSTSDRWGYLAVTGGDLDDCWLSIGRIGVEMAGACRRPEGC